MTAKELQTQLKQTLESIVDHRENCQPKYLIMTYKYRICFIIWKSNLVTQ